MPICKRAGQPHICKKYYAGNSAQDDMISIGTIGLIKAVDTFDPAKGKRFASYASRCIENAILTPTRFARQTVTVYRKPPLAGMYLRSFPLLIT